ncbi:unnamed protein product [Bursaphelenchus xylophilus]|uniref:(pine wood nematode) hypothetical protein n=1 Tax=Bursaphelenchus xylophilus TaxID=6326 RepID=A0A1I7RV18_BURXY|nr:unnamed protein product [Bursaphelenchus xylophilus]CAG9105202.1 unnamed protein product [Bursaphelenchus xylophilus]
MKRSYLMRRPDSDEEEDYYSSSREVKNKPIDSRYAAAFGGQKPSTFVKASHQSQQEFYGKQELMGRNKQQEEPVEAATSSRRPLTADEKNKLSAKILKAEMAGKKDKARKWKKQLESGFADSDDEGSSSKQAETKQDDSVLLMKIDKRTGVIQPASSESKMSGGKDRTHKSAVDSEFNRAASLDDLVRDEKKISSEDQLAMFSRAAKMTSGNKVDDDWVIDDNITSFKHKKRHEEKDAKKEHSKRVAGQLILNILKITVFFIKYSMI